MISFRLVSCPSDGPEICYREDHQIFRDSDTVTVPMGGSGYVTCRMPHISVESTHPETGGPGDPDMCRKLQISVQKTDLPPFELTKIR